LREQFCDENGIEYDLDDFPEEVSMLELVIGLAYRCHDIMEDSVDDMKMSDWFWKILSNIGLDKFTDDAFYGLKGQDLVKKILDIVIDRKYERSGKGGLFPLKRSKKDQRKVELWYQMNEYLVENYYSNEEIM
jgi:protein involved in sex pheromone biosynthesis